MTLRHQLSALADRALSLGLGGAQLGLAMAEHDRSRSLYATIALSRHQSVQGPILRQLRDGRVVIDSGRGEVTGRPT
ncbi:hypothetical protein [Paracoccus sp. (in: a-proteobacteria)]|uniref:hypothetical protein n=1 Tax=Paracoccus sp. TaxID=267 RepID=UPI002898CAD4|nr:hypothetical protein [Paracoccus sp. (in: a-proteobacteria)]